MALEEVNSKVNKKWNQVLRKEYSEHFITHLLCKIKLSFLLIVLFADYIDQNGGECLVLFMSTQDKV